MFATEKDGVDNTILLSVVREGGYFGHVAVQWVATGDHNGLQDISPLSGTVGSKAVAGVCMWLRDVASK